MQLYSAMLKKKASNWLENSNRHPSRHIHPERSQKHQTHTHSNPLHIIFLCLFVWHTISIHQQHTCFLEFFMAITAAMKNVLSPISEAKMTPHDFKNPSRN